MPDQAPPEIAPLWLVEIWRQLRAGEMRMNNFADELKENSVQTAKSRAVTDEVKALLDEGKAGLKVLGHIGVLAKWVGIVAGACTAVVTFIYAVTHPGVAGVASTAAADVARHLPK